MQDWFEQNAPKTNSGEDWFAANAPSNQSSIESRREAARQQFEANQPSLLSGFLSEAGKNTRRLGSVLLNTAPGADTGNTPTGITALDIARGAMEGGVAGPPEVSMSSGARALLKASPAAQTAVAVKDLAKRGSGTFEDAVKAYADRPREPISALTQALKPIATNTAFAAHAERALPEIKAAEQVLGKPIESVADLGDAIKVAKREIWSQYEQVAGPQAARGVDASPVADAIVKSIPLKLRMQNPEAAKQIENLANTYRRVFKLGELDDMLATTNAELEGYYAKYPAARSKAALANPDIAQNLAEAKSLRDLIYGQLDQGGNSVRDLKQTYGSLTNLEKETQRRLNVAARQNPESLSEQLSRWQAAAKLGRAAMTFPARPIGAIGDIASAYAGRTAATALKEANSADSLIANVFRNYKDLPSRPIPQMFEPKGLLGAGPTITPPPTDESFVRGIPAQPAVSGTPRMLTEGARQMPAAPDTSYVRGIPAELAKQVARLPKGLLYEQFGQAVKQAGAENTVNEMVSARLAQLKDIAQSGATETTGKGLREVDPSGRLGSVVRRGGGGFKVMFPELRNFEENPKTIAAAIDKGSGPLFSRIERAVRESMPEQLLQPSDLDFAFGANVSPIRAMAWDALRRLGKIP